MKDTAIAVGVVIALVLGGYAAFTTPETVTNTITERVSDAPGAVTSNVITQNALTVGGVQRYFASVKQMNAASTTICTIKAPSSTSTVDLVAFKVNTATATAVTVRAYKSASPFLATTNIAQTGFSAGAQGQLVSSSTGIGTNGVFSPGDYLVFVSTPTAGGNGAYTASGVCQATWTVL